MFQRQKHTEFSKKLLYVIVFITSLVVMFTFFTVLYTSDTTPLHYLIPAIFVEVNTATAFYYWKAKEENKIKLQIAYAKSMQTLDSPQITSDGDFNIEESLEELEEQNGLEIGDEYYF